MKRLLAGILLLMMPVLGCGLNSMDDIMGEEILGNLQVTVLDANGRAVSGCQVSSGSIWATTDTMGQAVLSSLSEGSCTLSANGTGLRPGTLETQVWAGRTEEISISLESINQPLDPAGYFPIDTGTWWNYKSSIPGSALKKQVSFSVSERRYLSGGSVSVLNLDSGRQLLVTRTSLGIQIMGDHNGLFTDGYELIAFRYVCPGQQVRSGFTDALGRIHSVLWTVEAIEDVATDAGIHKNCIALSRLETIGGDDVTTSQRRDLVWLALNRGPVMFSNPDPDRCDCLFLNQATLTDTGITPTPERE